MRSVVVTGASTGIGAATAKVLIERGYRVFGSVRKEADAERLTRELGARACSADLRDRCSSDAVLRPVR